MELQGKTAVITGGASGIGLASARQFASSGVNLVLGDIDDVQLQDVVEELRANGARVVGICADVSREADVVTLRDAALAEFGAVHIVFNNAGVGAGPTVATPKKVWDWVLGVNVDGVVNGINAFVPLFLEQNEGHVINTASLAGLGGVAGIGVYCASKFAVVGISESLFFEMRAPGNNVGVSVLCPGYVRTRIWESYRTMPADLRHYNDVAEVQSVNDSIRASVESGIEASDVAQAIERAVRTGQFWILTHERAATKITEQRLEWMRGGPSPGSGLDGAHRP